MSHTLLSSRPYGSRLALSAALVLALGGFAGQARADEHHGTDHNQIDGARVDLHANVDGYGMFGVGGRVELPIVPDGLIRGDVHDELALSLGADVLFSPVDRGYYDGGGYVVPIAAVQWNFYLGSNWSVFPEAGVAVHFDFDHDGYRDHGWSYVQPDLGLGARYHFQDRLALLMRVSSPGGLQVGLTF